jgi:hypothetical protein
MSKLPPPSDTPRVFMNIGTLSGLDVLTFGKIAPGATIELKNGSTGQIISVKGRRLTRHGVIAGSAEIELTDGSIITASNRDIATVLREAPPLTAAPSADGVASPVSSAAHPAGV